MKDATCRDVADKLVEYADGELPPDEAALVARHLADCRRCHAVVVALQRSLELAKAVWADVEVGGSEEQESANPVWWRRDRVRRSLMAASIAIVFVGSIAWYVGTVTDDGSKAKPTFASRSITLAEAEQEIMEVGISTRMLAVADYLAEHSVGRDIAAERYRYILQTYPETEAAQLARSRLQAIQ